jgi:hypothetical protein
MSAALFALQIINHLVQGGEICPRGPKSSAGGQNKLDIEHLFY